MEWHWRIGSEGLRHHFLISLFPGRGGNVVIQLLAHLAMPSLHVVMSSSAYWEWGGEGVLSLWNCQPEQTLSL